MGEMIRRLFKLQRGEGAKVLLFTLLGALLQAGLAVGMSASESLFLVKVGADRLPYVYLITPLMMLVYTSIYSWLISRIGIDRVFDLTLALLIAAGAALAFALEGSHPALFYGARLYSALWYIALYTLFWNFTDSYYDIQDAKRLFPLFNGGAATGAMLGGSLVTVLSHRMPVEKLFLAWSGLALLAVPLLVLLRRRVRKIEVDTDDEKPGFVQEIRETRRFIGQSHYVRLFILVLFTALVLTTLVEFQYSQIFSINRSERQLVALFGTLFAVVNGFNLIVNFFLFNRMVLAFGVGNVALATPVVYLVTFLILLINYGEMAGFVGFFAYQGILTSIDWNNTNFLFNAITPEAKKQVRTFIEGLCEPLATAAAGGFLLLCGTKEGYDWLHGSKMKEDVALLSPEGIAAIGLAGSGLYLVLAVLLRSSYLRSMVLNLKREWLDFSKPASDVLIGLDAAQVEMLTERARTGDRETAHTAVHILWLNDRRRALEALLAFLAGATPEDRVASERLLEQMLAEEDHEMIRVLLEWLEARDELPDAALLQGLASHSLIPPQEVARLFLSTDPEQQAAAVIAAWSNWSLSERRRALEVIDRLLAGEASEQAAAVRALGRTGQERNAHTLIPYLDAADPRIRREALLSLNRLVTRDSRRLVPALIRAIGREDAEGRITGMHALARIADPNSVEPLLAISHLFTPYERREAEAVLRGAGLKSVPTAVAVLRNPRHTYPARSIAARTLSKLASPQLDALSPALISAELQRAYHFLEFHRVLEKELGRTDPTPDSTSTARPASGADTAHVRTDIPVRHPSPPGRGAGGEVPASGLRVLSCYYRDMRTVIVDFVLELLTLGGRLPDFELVSASLRSTNRKERGNAIETIEQGVSREVFKLLLPLVDGRSLGEQIDAYHPKEAPLAAAGATCPPEPWTIVSAALESASALEAAAAAQALWKDEAPESAAMLRRRLRAIDSGADDLPANSCLRETLLSLLFRTEHDAALNLVERLGCLLSAPFFQAFTVPDLELLARSAGETSFEPGARIFSAGDAADALYVICTGWARVEGDPLAPLRHGGDTIGEEALFGESQRRSAAVSEGIVALRIPAPALHGAAQTSPRVAISLLAKKMRASSAT